VEKSVQFWYQIRNFRIFEPRSEFYCSSFHPCGIVVAGGDSFLLIFCYCINICLHISNGLRFVLVIIGNSYVVFKSCSMTIIMKFRNCSASSFVDERRKAYISCIFWWLHYILQIHQSYSQKYMSFKHSNWTVSRTTKYKFVRYICLWTLDNTPNTDHLHAEIYWSVYI
jgi:hypothetical protein